MQEACLKAMGAQDRNSGQTQVVNVFTVRKP